MNDLITTLQKRGFIDAITHEELRDHLKEPRRVYCGFDPTSDSLHLGNLVAMMGLAWFQRYGHTPVAIVGGATGRIGDPSGKQHERPLLTAEAIEQNLAGISKDLQTLLKPVILNNYDWFKEFTVLDFLRDVGKQFRMGPMLSKESVKLRLASDEGMSFTEFSYQMLQAYDFAYLYKKQRVTVQLGGSDQWGNITAGIELTRREHGEQVFGVTFPLLTRSDGKKFGKSESGAIWLSKEKLSVYDFYQYLFRTPDADVIKMLKMLTFLDLEEIDEIEKGMDTPNSAQKRLAAEVTRLIHGEEGLAEALKLTEQARPGAETELSYSTLSALPSVAATQDLLGTRLVDALVLLGIQKSKGDVRRLIQNGGLYLNNVKVTDEQRALAQEDFIEGKLALVALGKKNKLCIMLS